MVIGGVGTHLYCLPAFRAIWEQFRPRVTLVTNYLLPHVADERSHHPFVFDEFDVKRVFVLAWKNGARWEVQTESPKIPGSQDFVISLAPDPSDSVIKLAQIMRAKVSIGFGPGFTIAVEPNATRHSVEQIFELATYCRPGLTPNAYVGNCRFPDEALSFVRALRRDLPHRARIVTVHADGALGRMWEPRRFRNALNRFLSAHEDCYAFLVGGRSPFAHCADHLRIIPCYGIPVAWSSALVAHSDLFVGLDSCMLRFADLGRVPSVGLFGSRCPVERGFLFSKNISLLARGSMLNISEPDVCESLDAVYSETVERQSSSSQTALASDVLEDHI